MSQGPIRAEALGDMELLAQVVAHKQIFYPAAWAHYELARPASLHLIPVAERRAALERDYRDMAVMIFGEPPSFEEVMETLAGLENEVNKR